MTKDELIDEIADQTGFTKKDCMLFVNVLCDIIRDALKRGERIKIVNFGVFEVKECKARTGKNFADNSRYPIPPRKIPTFIPSEGLKRIVRGINYDKD